MDNLTFELPEFLSDVSIISAQVPAKLDGITTRGVLWQATSECFLLNLPGIARYLVDSGRIVTIDALPGTPKQTVDYFMKMLPFAALMFQRGLLALHATAVTNGDGAVLLAGDSGSGKSALLLALLQRGWRMLADDLTVVGLDDDGKPIVYPVSHKIALWPATLKFQGVPSYSLTKCDENRLEYSLLQQHEIIPQRLRSIYRLNVHNKCEVELETIADSLRFSAIGSMLYNSHVADALYSRTDYLRCAAAVAQAAPIKILCRPRGVWSVEMLANHISI